MYKLIFLMLIFSFKVFGADGKFVLLCGPSGVGKSTIINHLKNIDSRFVYISPYTTRELRVGEEDKIHISLEEMESLELEGKLLTINKIYGNFYATPKEAIDNALTEGKFPILDWPISNLKIMHDNYGLQLYTVYIQPDSLEMLAAHLAFDNRDVEGKRFEAAQTELHSFHLGNFDEDIHLKVINYQGKDLDTSLEIYHNIINKSF